MIDCNLLDEEVEVLVATVKLHYATTQCVVLIRSSRPRGVAEAVANAAKEGDFMGIGGQRVSAAETAVLGEIKAALGL